MAKFLVTNVYKYTATVEVEADSKSEALDVAMGLEDQPNNDDWLYESTAQVISN